MNKVISLESCLCTKSSSRRQVAEVLPRSFNLTSTRSISLESLNDALDLTTEIGRDCAESYVKVVLRNSSRKCVVSTTEDVDEI